MKWAGLACSGLLAGTWAAEMLDLKWNKDIPGLDRSHPFVQELLDLNIPKAYVQNAHPGEALLKDNLYAKTKLDDPPAVVWNPNLSAGETLAYGRMAQWSAAAYCSQDSLLSWSCGPRCRGATQDTHVVMYFKSSITDTVGYIGTYTDLENQRDNIVIAFRGSVTLQNWIENMKFGKEPSPWPDSKFPGARVHSGFLDSYADIASTIRGAITVLRKRYPQARIVVTGHSLGGAIATLCAADLKFHLGWSVAVELVTFHSPRVGNADFIGFIDNMFQTSTVTPVNQMEYMVRRFTNRADPLSHMPPAFLDFKHVSQEVWVDLENRTQACDPARVEDPNCSNSVVFPDDISNHFYIWNVFFGMDCSV